MTEASFASLGPRLLARKGGAKPAMRPQAASLPSDIATATGANADQLEDLGWNDMGAEEANLVETAAPVTPAPVKAASVRTGPAKTAKSKNTTGKAAKNTAKVVPISAKSAADIAPKPKKSKPVKSKSKSSAKRAAFTLRLDADRHLKLRLASTMHNMSAQALVTQALDQMLDEIEDLDALVQRMKRR